MASKISGVVFRVKFVITSGEHFEVSVKRTSFVNVQMKKLWMYRGSGKGTQEWKLILYFLYLFQLYKSTKRDGDAEGYKMSVKCVDGRIHLATSKTLRHFLSDCGLATTVLSSAILILKTKQRLLVKQRNVGRSVCSTWNMLQ